jgi:hypothetical protein
MIYHNAITGTETMGTGLPEPLPSYHNPVGLTWSGKPRKLRRTTTRVSVIPVDPKRLENCTILGPEEHAEIGPSPYELVRAAFIDSDDTPGLYHFLEAIDQVHMGQSVDLNFWLTRWRGTQG